MNEQDIEALYALRDHLRFCVNIMSSTGRRMFERTLSWEGSGKPSQALMEWSQWMAFSQANGWTLRSIHDQVQKAIRAYEEAHAGRQAPADTDVISEGPQDAGLDWWKRQMEVSDDDGA